MRLPSKPAAPPAMVRDPIERPWPDTPDHLPDFLESDGVGGWMHPDDFMAFEDYNRDYGNTPQDVSAPPMTPAERKQAVHNLRYWASDETNTRRKAWYLDIAARLEQEDAKTNGR